MRAFIVRPFGVKEGIDFDRVERELIQPALQRLRALGHDVEGGTTGEIARAGNIREDMFRLLVVEVTPAGSLHRLHADREMLNLGAAVGRFVVPLKTMCSRKCEMPFWSLDS